MEKIFVRVKLVFILKAVTFVCTQGQFCSNTNHVYPYTPVKDVCAVGVATPIVKKDGYTVPCCQTCSCSSDCLYHNDCCPDADVHDVDNRPDVKCIAPLYNARIPLQQIDGNSYGVNMYNMVTSCLKTHPLDSTLKKCESTVPGDIRSAVVVSDTNDRVYKNEYCARCNHVYNYTTWRLKVKLPVFAKKGETVRPLIDSLIENNFMFWSLPPRQHIGEKSRCFVPLFDTCNATGNWLLYDKILDDACANSTLHYIDNAPPPFNNRPTEIYKNVFCYLCNQGPNIKLQDTCKVSTNMGASSTRSEKGMSFVGILNLDAADRFDKSNLLAKEFKCRLDEVYDDYFKLCRKLQCPLGMFPLYADCIKTYNSERGNTFAIAFETTLPTQYLGNDYHLNNIIQAVSSKINDLGFERTSCGVCEYRVVDDAKNSQSDGKRSQTDVIIEMIVYTTGKCNTQTIWNFFESLNSTPYNLIVNVEENINIPLTLQVNKLYKSLPYEQKRQRLTVAYSRTACGPITILTGLNCPRVELNGSHYDVLYTPDENAPLREYVITKVSFDNATNETNISYELCLKTLQNSILKRIQNKSISTWSPNGVMFLVGTSLISVTSFWIMV